MAEVLDRLLDPANRQPVIAACSAEIRNQVSQQGLTVRAGFKVAQSAKPNLVESAMGYLLPDFAQVLDQHYIVYQQQTNANKDFVSYCSEHSKSIANELLSITDRLVDNDVENRMVKSGYKKLRGKAETEVSKSLPDLVAVLMPFIKQ